jgi:transposase
LDHVTLEAIRLRAVERIKAGEHPEVVSRSLGFHPKTAYKWLKADREGGVDALLARPVPGAKGKLTDVQLRRLYTLITQSNPQAFGFEGVLWTRKIIRDLIIAEFKVTMTPQAVGKLLHRLGLSPQRPLWRAYQSDPQAVTRWKTQEFPAIRKAAQKDGASVYFEDEAGIRSDYHAGTTWAPVGQTPVVQATGARHRLNMISAVSAQGLLRFEVTTGTVTAQVFLEFCKKVLADTKRDTGKGVAMIVDGASIHTAKIVADWVTSTDGDFKLYRLPAYSPQLNPDEWVWKHVKHDQIGRRAPRTKDQFLELPKNALTWLKERPEIIRGFFRDPDLAYITT